MTTLQHEPLTKRQVKAVLYEFLYTPAEKQFRTRLDTLIVQNTLITGFSHKSFNYKGVLYSCDTTPAPRKWNKLSPQLKDQMDEYLQEVDELNRKELPYVLGYINQVLNSSSNFGDYLKLFPECLHPPLKKLIDSCPCHTAVLEPRRIAELTKQHQDSIILIKKRMVINLLI